LLAGSLFHCWVTGDAEFLLEEREREMMSLVCFCEFDTEGVGFPALK